MNNNSNSNNMSSQPGLSASMGKRKQSAAVITEDVAAGGGGGGSGTQLAFNSHQTENGRKPTTTTTTTAAATMNDHRWQDHGSSSQTGTPHEDNNTTSEHNNQPSRDDTNIRWVLDEQQCRALRLLVGAVCSLAITADGDYIFVGGEDGCIFTLTTSRRTKGGGGGGGSMFGARQPTTLTNNASDEDDDDDGDDDDLTPLFYLFERGRLNRLRGKLRELETTLEQSKKDSDIYVNKLLEGKEKILVDMETRLRREIAKRDESIVSGRKEYLSMKKNMQDQLDALRQSSSEALAAMELQYEKRLAGDALYLDKLRQAYDEYVLNLKMDMGDLHKQTADKIRAIENDRTRSVHEAEKQKLAVLTYYEYIKARHDEVMTSLEEQQTEERLKLKSQVASVNAQLSNANAAHLSSETAHSRQVLKLNNDLNTRDMEIMRVQTDINWANERIRDLEEKLTLATAELKVRSDLVEKLESRMGEATKRIEDLEKIRSTLMAQLATLQSDIGPKQAELHRAAEKLQEMMREYEVALGAISEKDTTLDQRAQSLILLQKQVREMRMVTSQKDAALNRAATLLHEFIYTMQEARFQPHKSTAQLAKEAADAEKKVQGKQQKEKSTSKSTNNNSGGADAKKASNQVAPSREVSSAERNLLSSRGGGSSGRPAAVASDPYYFITSLRLEENAESKLRSLHDVLKAYLSDDRQTHRKGTGAGNHQEILDEAEAVRREQDRHVALLHRNLHILQNGINTAQQAAQNKVANHLADNQSLLLEVNYLRAEVKALSLDKQRLQAMLEFNNARHAEQQARDQQLLLQLHSQQGSVVADPLHQAPALAPNPLSDRRSSSIQAPDSQPIVGNHHVDSRRGTIDLAGALLPRLTRGGGGSGLQQQQQQQSLSQLHAQRASLAVMSSSLDAEKFAREKNRRRNTVENGPLMHAGEVAIGSNNLLGGVGSNHNLSADDKIAALMKMNQDQIRKGSK